MVYLRDSWGRVLGLVTAAKSFESIEDILRAHAGASNGTRVFIMARQVTTGTGTSSERTTNYNGTFKLMAASVPDVSWVAVAPFESRQISVVNCTDKLIQKSGLELDRKGWPLDSTIISSDGEHYIATRKLMKFSRHDISFSDPHGWVVVSVKQVACAAGYIVDNTTLACDKCPAGKVSSGGSVSRCISCPSGSWAERASYECHECSAGYYQSSRGCSKCQLSYDSLPGSTNCELCIKGFFWNGDGKCVACPAHARCEGEDFLPAPDEDYWVDYSDRKYWAGVSSEEANDRIIPCNRRTCHGARESKNGNKTLSDCWRWGNYSYADCMVDELLCREGATGILCGACISSGPKKYIYNSLKRRCVACLTDGEMIRLVVSAGTTLLFLFCMWALYHYVHWIHNNTDHFFSDSIRNLHLVPVMKLLRQFDIGKIKVIWVGVSIVSTVSTTVEIEWPEPMKTLISIYSWTQLDLWSGIGISCYYNGISSFHGHAIFTSLAPMAVWALIWSTWFLRTTLASARRDTDFADVDVMGAMERAKACRKQLVEKRAQILEEHMAVFLVVSYLVLPSVTMVQFKSLRCTDYSNIIRSGASEHSGVFLNSDSSVDCQSKEHHNFILVITPLIVIYQAIPVLYYILLYRVRHKLNPKEDASGDKAVHVLHSAKTDLQLMPLKFLFKGYEPEFWYWEIVETYRRIVFISLIPVIINTTTRRAVVGSLLAIMSSVLYREMNPFKTPSTNMLSMVAQYQIMITYIAAMLLDANLLVGLSEHLQGALLGGVLALLNLLVLLMFVGLAVRGIAIYAWTHRQLLAHKLQGHAHDLDDESKLPKVLRDFVPIINVPHIEEAVEGLPLLEEAFLKAHIIRARKNIIGFKKQRTMEFKKRRSSQSKSAIAASIGLITSSDGVSALTSSLKPLVVKRGEGKREEPSTSALPHLEDKILFNLKPNAESDGQDAGGKRRDDVASEPLSIMAPSRFKSAPSTSEEKSTGWVSGGAEEKNKTIGDRERSSLENSPVDLEGSDESSSPSCAANEAQGDAASGAKQSSEDKKAEMGAAKEEDENKMDSMVNQRVVIRKLASNEELNGMVGTVLNRLVKDDDLEERYTVKLDGPEEKVVKLSPVHFELKDLQQRSSSNFLHGHGTSRNPAPMLGQMRGSITNSFNQQNTMRSVVNMVTEGVSSAAANLTQSAAAFKVHDLKKMGSNFSEVVLKGEEKSESKAVKDALEEVTPIIQNEIDKRLVEKGIIKTCDQVLQSSKMVFEGVYSAVWNLVCYTEEHEIELYVQAVKLLTKKGDGNNGTHGHHARQRTHDILELYTDAASCWQQFEQLITHLAAETDTEPDIPKTLKRLSRVLEKILFDFKGPGAADKVCDVVRAMLKASTMNHVIALVFAFINCEEIVVVRVKDRFVTKSSPGGWRDLMINFFFIDDPQQHVCEVQIVHKKMLVARQGLPGHAIYDRVRNASEILEKLDVANPAKRADRARMMRETDVSTREALDMGFDVIDLVKAGFGETDLIAHGVDEEEVKLAKAALIAQRHKVQGRREIEKGTGPTVRRDSRHRLGNLNLGGRRMSKGKRKTMADAKDGESSYGKPQIDFQGTDSETKLVKKQARNRIRLSTKNLGTLANAVVKLEHAANKVAHDVDVAAHKHLNLSNRHSGTDSLGAANQVDSKSPSRRLSIRKIMGGSLKGKKGQVVPIVKPETAETGTEGQAGRDEEEGEDRPPSTRVSQVDSAATQEHERATALRHMQSSIN